MNKTKEEIKEEQKQADLNISAICKKQKQKNEKNTGDEEIKTMSKIYITSDNHFYHGNIIRYCKRPFKTYQEMNAHMIKQWNSIVNQDDIVFHLGDFAYKGKAKKIRKKLNGTIILIRGNHDEYITNKDGFIIVKDKLLLDNFILTHEPLAQDKIPEGFINIHGHIHDKKSYFGINISVERTNYMPVLLSTLK